MDGKKINWTDFHDAELVFIKVLWEKQEIFIDIILSEMYVDFTEKAQIVLKKVSNINCPINYPWGKSVFINEIRFIQVDKDKNLEIEMQSGDLITVIADEIHIEAKDTSVEKLDKQ